MGRKYLENCMTNRASIRVLKQKRISISLGGSIRLASQLHPVDNTNKFLAGMRNRNIVMLALGPFLG